MILSYRIVYAYDRIRVINSTLCVLTTETIIIISYCVCVMDGHRAICSKPAVILNYNRRIQLSELFRLASSLSIKYIIRDTMRDRRTAVRRARYIYFRRRTNRAR